MVNASILGIWFLLWGIIPYMGMAGPRVSISKYFLSLILCHIQLQRSIMCWQTTSHYRGSTTLGSRAIQETSKLEVPKITKRNNVSNLRITYSWIWSIQTKQKSYKNWKRTALKISLIGNVEKYNKFSYYRWTLKKVIKGAKIKFHDNKFEECKGDMNKHGMS